MCLNSFLLHLSCYPLIEYVSQRKKEIKYKKGNKTQKMTIFYFLKRYELVIMDYMLLHKFSLFCFGACFEAVCAPGSLHDSSLFDARHEPFLSSHQLFW